MGWKRTLRSVRATVKNINRKIEKIRRKRERELEELKTYRELKAAQDEVRIYVTELDELTNIHKIRGLKIDWKSVASIMQPEEPKLDSTIQDRFKKKIKNYEANSFEKTIKLDSLKTKFWSKIAEVAEKQSTEVYKEMHAAWEKENKEWSRLNKIAKGVLVGNTKVYRKALEEVEFNSQIKKFIKGFEINFPDKESANIKMIMNSKDVVPKIRKKILKTGKVSTTNMPEPRRNEIYFDHISSVLLLTGKVLFDILPLSAINIEASIKETSKKTGHKDNIPVLEVKFTSEIMNSINLRKVDPSEALSNFEHRSNYAKSRGFKKLEKEVK